VILNSTLKAIGGELVQGRIEIMNANVNLVLHGSKILADAIARIMSVSQYQLNVEEKVHRHLRDALTSGQLGSKLAAVNHLSDYKMLRALIIGQWHGLLPRLLYKYDIIKSCVGIEIDDFWSNFSCRVNNDWSYRSITADATTSKLELYNTDLIINTSCEHMSWDWLNFKFSYPVLVYAQSSNYVHHEHVNRIDSLDELVEQFQCRGMDIVVAEDKKFEVYNRYCVLAKYKGGTV